MNILDLITDKNLLGPHFHGRSWDRWRSILKATYALPLTRRELELFHEVAGERDPPKQPIRELVAIIGRGGGKDACASALATYIAITGNFSRLRPGERGTILCLANDRDQAAIAFAYLRGYFEDVPMLASMVERVTADTIDLVNGASIVVATSNFRSPRGRTVICAIYDEVAFWRSEQTAAPDIEVDAAIAPGLMRWKGSLKILISSAYRRSGLLYERYKAIYGQDDADCLAVLGTSLQFNPSLDEQIIERELQKDYARASAEYLSIWRDDLSTFITRPLVEELVDKGIRERPYDPNIRTYSGFVDEAGGGGSNSSTLAICHVEKGGMVIQDLMRIWRPPFSPEQVITEKCVLLKGYGIKHVTGDHWAGGLPPERYRVHGIKFEQSGKTKSDYYLDLLTLLHSKRLRMLDEPTQFQELLALERRVRWGGKESVDHPQIAGAHDDAVNSLAGSAVLASSAKHVIHITPALMEASKRPGPVPVRRSMIGGAAARWRPMAGRR